MGHQCNRVSRVKGLQYAAYEPHIVIKGQPAHEDITGAGLDGLAIGADVRQQVGMREDDTLGVSRAARGVLQKGDIVGPERRLLVVLGPGAQLLDGRHLAQRLDVLFEQPGKQLRLGDREHHHGPAVREDGALTTQVVLDLRGPHGWVNGHRDTAGQEHAKESRVSFQDGDKASKEGKFIDKIMSSLSDDERHQLWVIMEKMRNTTLKELGMTKRLPFPLW